MRPVVTNKRFYVYVKLDVFDLPTVLRSKIRFS